MPEAAARQRIHGGRRPGQALVDFSVDINPFGFPESVREAVLSHLDALASYPDSEARALREQIAAQHDLPAASVLPGNGSAELIPLVVRALRPARALVVAPTFTEYEWALEQDGVETRYLLARAEQNFAIPDDSGAWASAVSGVDLVFLCNPNNPTGAVLPREAVERVACWCEEAGATLVVDEAFVDWTEEPSAISAAPLLRRQARLIVLRSLTKLFALPGLRLGYLLAAPELVARLRAHQPAWPLNTFALAVGERVLREPAYVEQSRRLVRDSATELFDGLRGLGWCRPFPSAVNFILCEVALPHTAGDLCRRLAEQGLLVRNCDDFTGLAEGQFIRVAVRTPEENARLLAALRAIGDHAG